MAGAPAGLKPQREIEFHGVVVRAGSQAADEADRRHRRPALLFQRKFVDQRSARAAGRGAAIAAQELEQHIAARRIEVVGDLHQTLAAHAAYLVVREPAMHLAFPAPAEDMVVDRAEALARL